MNNTKNLFDKQLIIYENQTPGNRTKTRQFESSSSISSVEYDNIHQQLKITFKTGKTYQYGGVPEDVASPLFSNDLPSAGSYVHSKIIKGAYPYKELKQE